MLCSPFSVSNFPHFPFQISFAPTLPRQYILSNSLFQMQTHWNNENITKHSWVQYLVDLVKTLNHSFFASAGSNSPSEKFSIFDLLHIFKARHICIWIFWYFLLNILKYFWISIFLCCKIWAGCSRLSANIGRFSNLASLTQILHFVFVSAIFAVCLLQIWI